MNNGSITAAAPAGLGDLVPPVPLVRTQVLHAHNRSSDAERVCRAILTRQPAHPSALSLLGTMMTRTHRAAEVAERLRRVPQCFPIRRAADINYGDAAGVPSDNGTPRAALLPTARGYLSANPRNHPCSI